MKKTALFIAILLASAPLFVSAQVATTTPDSSKEALIAVLTQLVQTLESEIQAIIAQQQTLEAQQQTITNQQQALSQQQQMVTQQQDQVTQQQTQTLGSSQQVQQTIPASPSCIPNPTLTLSPNDNGNGIFTATYTTGCPIDPNTSVPFSFSVTPASSTYPILQRSGTFVGSCTSTSPKGCGQYSSGILPTNENTDFQTWIQSYLLAGSEPLGTTTASIIFTAGNLTQTYQASCFITDSTATTRCQ